MIIYLSGEVKEIAQRALPQPHVARAFNIERCDTYRGLVTSTERLTRLLSAPCRSRMSLDPSPNSTLSG